MAYSKPSYGGPPERSTQSNYSYASNWPPLQQRKVRTERTEWHQRPQPQPHPQPQPQFHFQSTFHSYSGTHYYSETYSFSETCYQSKTYDHHDRHDHHAQPYCGTCGSVFIRSKKGEYECDCIYAPDLTHYYVSELKALSTEKAIVVDVLNIIRRIANYLYGSADLRLCSKKLYHVCRLFSHTLETSFPETTLFRMVLKKIDSNGSDTYAKLCKYLSKGFSPETMEKTLWYHIERPHTVVPNVSLKQYDDAFMIGMAYVFKNPVYTEDGLRWDGSTYAFFQDYRFTYCSAYNPIEWFSDPSTYPLLASYVVRHRIEFDLPNKFYPKRIEPNALI